MPDQHPPKTPADLTRRRLLGTAGATTLALAGGSLTARPAKAQDEAATTGEDVPDAPFAFIDGTGPGWNELGEKDFAKVNSDADTWRWEEGVLYCTGKPISVMRSAKLYTNFEICLEWCHREFGGNSGLFVWADPKVIERMTAAGTRGLPNGVEVQILDLGYEEVFKKQYPGRTSEWFTSHGDVFPVRQKLDVFPPKSPDGSRSFPSENRVKPHGNWNHYYVRCINGEVRLWVNGKEVSGGNNSSVTTGYICLESEGAPIEFKNIRLRELP